MKAKLSRWFAAVPLIFMFLFFSCTEEIFESFDFEKSEIIGEAKNWFTKNNNSVLPFKRGENLAPLLMIPDWGKAYYFRSDNMTIVETPLKAKGSLGLATESNFNKWNQSKNSKYVNSTTRLVIVNNGESIYSHIMTIIGNEDYLEKGNFTYNNSFYELQEDFSGYVLYHNIKGEFIKGYSYEKGKKIGELIKSDKTKSNISSLRTVCQTMGMYAIYQDCQYLKDVNEVGGYEITWESCSEPYSVLLYTYLECTYVPDEEDDANTGSGGETDGTSTSAQNAYENLKKMIKKHNLNNDQYERLLLAFEVLTNQMCMFKTIVNQAVNNGSQFEVVIGSTQSNVPAQYNYIDNTITFRSESDINSYNLGEELTHFHQDNFAYSGGLQNYGTNNGRVNIEFEVKLFGDIATHLYNANEDPQVPYNCCKATFNSSQDFSEYFFWINSLTSSGSTPDWWTVSQRYNEFLGKFYNSNTHYGTPRYNMQPNSLLNGLNFCN